MRKNPFNKVLGATAIHSLYLIQNFLVKHGIHIIRQVSYSPDIAPGPL